MELGSTVSRRERDRRWWLGEQRSGKGAAAGLANDAVNEHGFCSRGSNRTCWAVARRTEHGLGFWIRSRIRAEGKGP
jgi:hypothetical protein